jgi:hypothetical protein
MRTKVDSTQRKNKSKQSTKVGEDPMQRGLMDMKRFEPQVQKLSIDPYPERMELKPEKQTGIFIMG